MAEPKKIRGHGSVEKDKRYKNTWKITFNTGEKDEKGRYVRAPKRTIHGSKAQAYAALEQYIADYERGNDPANQTIAEYAWHFHELREGDPKLSPNSYKREMLDIRYIEEIFGDIKMKDLSPALIREREAKARKEGKHSESMLHKMHQKLRQIMQDAYLNEIIMRNPVDLVPFPRPRPKTERQSMTPEELARLFKAADEEGGAYATGLMLIAATGLRKSEMLGLTWKYVDFEHDQFFVAFQRGADKQLRPPKTKLSQRWLCIRGYMSEKLKAWKVEQAEYLAALGIEQTDDTPVFNNDLGGFIDEANYGRWWRSFSVDHGFGEFTEDVRTSKMNGKTVTRGKKYQGFTLHELRHTQATLIQSVVSPKAAQHRLGHSQISMTMNTYAHFLDSEDLATAAAIDEILRPKE